MRGPDKHRLQRAVEHLNAALTHIDSFKWENRTEKEERWLERTTPLIRDASQQLGWIIDEKI